MDLNCEACPVERLTYLYPKRSFHLTCCNAKSESHNNATAVPVAMQHSEHQHPSVRLPPPARAQQAAAGVGSR